MKAIRIFFALAALAVLCACATTRPSMSYVAPELTPGDAAVLASDTATHLAEPLPPAKSTVVLDPPAGQRADALTPALLSALRGAGYGVIEADRRVGPQAGEGTPVRYLVSPLENGVVLRLQYLGTEASRFYPRTVNGTLEAAGPFTVRESGQ